MSNVREAGLPTPILNLHAIVGISVAGATIPLAAILVGSGLTSSAAALLIFGAVAFLASAPYRTLPAIALVSFVAFPHWLFDGVWLIRDIGPAPFALLFWVIRGFLADVATEGARHTFRPAPLRRVACVAMILFAWLLVSRFESDYSPNVWIISFACATVLPWLAPYDFRVRPTLVAAWVWVGGALGCLTVIEQFVGHPIIYGSLYADRGLPPVQHWSVYRSVGPFEHPLYAGMFLSVAVALGVGRYVSGDGRWQLALGGMSLAGVVATVGRGSIAAAAFGLVAIAVVSAASTIRSTRSRTFVLVGLGVVAVAVVANLSLLTDRADSQEASTSSSARLDILRIAYTISQSAGVFGSGPGTSSRFSAHFTSLVLENSWLQILVSIGFIGLLIFVAFVALLGVDAWRRRDVIVVGGLVSYFVSISTFNAIDDAPSMHFVLAMLLVISSQRRRSDAALEAIGRIEVPPPNWRRGLPTRAHRTLGWSVGPILKNSGRVQT